MEISNALLSAAAVLTALGVIGIALRKVYTFAKKIESSIGSDSEGRSLSDRIARVEHQVFPNGGGSLSDQVHNVQLSIENIDARTELMEAMLIAVTTKKTNSTHNNTKRPRRSPGEKTTSTATKKTTTKEGS